MLLSYGSSSKEDSQIASFPVYMTAVYLASQVDIQHVPLTTEDVMKTYLQN